MRRTTVLLVLLAWGCQGPASIEVEPQNPLITTQGGTVQLKATVKDKQGKVLQGATVSFKSLTPTMASVDAGGTVTAVTSGTATILIEAGDVSKQVGILIQIAKRIQIDPEGPLLMLGVTRGFKGTVIDDRDNPLIAGKIRWTSSDTGIFTVDEHGNVKTVGEGKATLTAHAAGIKDTTEITVKHEELQEDGTLTQ